MPPKKKRKRGIAQNKGGRPKRKHIWSNRQSTSSGFRLDQTLGADDNNMPDAPLDHFRSTDADQSLPQIRHPQRTEDTPMDSQRFQ